MTTINDTHKYILTKEWIKKDGSKTIKNYNQKIYTDTFNEKNKNKFKEHVKCECGLTYARSNRYNHIITYCHITLKKLKENEI
jgi:hypothetical protein